jgi:outer membrane protein TolC
VGLKTYGLQSFLKSRALTLLFLHEFMLSSVLISLRRSRRVLPVLAGLVVVSLARAQVPAVAGTFPEDYLPALKPILATALRQSPQVIAKQLELEQSALRVMGANSLRLPSLGGNLTFASNETSISSNNSTRTRDNGVFYNFGLNQSIYHWGALKNEGDKARIGVLIAQKSYAEASRTLAVTVRRSYLELIVKKSLLRQMRFARDLTVSDLKLAKEKLANGTFSQGDIGARELNLSEEQLRVRRAEVELTTLRRSFARLSGIGEISEDAIPNEIPAPVYNAAATSALLASLVRDGAKQTFQAQVSEQKVRLAELDYRIARVRLLPKFGASAGYSLENTTNASATSVSQQGVARQTLAIGAQWAIFDGFASRAAKRDALVTKRAAELELKTASEAAIDAAQALVQQLELDVEAMEMSAVRVGLATAQVSNVQNELKLGNLPQNAVDQTLSGLRVMEFNNANARATFLGRWSEFASLVGIDPVLNQLPARHDSTKR